MRLVGGDDLDGARQVEAEAGEEGEHAGAGSRLRRHSPADLWIVGEKVVEPGEHAAADVIVAGNGYADREVGTLVGRVVGEGELAVPRHDEAAGEGAGDEDIEALLACGVHRALP